MTYLTTSDLDRAIKESRRTPEAEAQIAAAREPPGDMEVAMQEFDRVLEEDGARMSEQNADPPRRILTTNHPEVTDPAERERLGLEPLSFEVKGCATPGCGYQAGHEARHPCGQPLDRGSVEEGARRAHAAAAKADAAVGAFMIGEPKDPSFYWSRLDICRCGQRRGDHDGAQPQACPEAGCKAFVLAEAHDPRARPAVDPAEKSARRCGQPCPDCGVTLAGMAHVCDDWTRTDSEVIALCGDDAGKWAREFIAMRRSNGRIPLDEGLMISWFANAIESRPKPTLAGEDVDIFDAFGRACAALEAHAEAGQKLNADYRAALEQVSRMAARRNRGR